MTVLVFRTNVRLKRQQHGLLRTLSAVDAIERCTIDLDDRDKVLRVTLSAELCPRAIETLVKESGFHCEELED